MLDFDMEKMFWKNIEIWLYPSTNDQTCLKWIQRSHVLCLMDLNLIIKAHTHICMGSMLNTFFAYQKWRVYDLSYT